MLIKPEVEMSIFDDGNTAKSYLISLNGRNWRVSRKVYLILEALMSPKKNEEEVAAGILAENRITVSPSEVQQVKDFARKNGLAVGTETESKRPKSNAYLWGRITFFPQSLVSRIHCFVWLFRPGLMLPLLSVCMAWLIYMLLTNSAQTVSDQFHSMSITDVIGAYLVIFAIGLIHEMGHASALMRCGQKPGRIGAGVYFIMPVFFSDVTCAWKLKRFERVSVDIGGIYLQLVAMLIVYVINGLTFHSVVVEVAILLSSLEILGNLNPFIRLDGYWILADLLGVPNTKRAMLQLITWPFQKPQMRSSEISTMSCNKKIILIIYLILCIVFCVYFGRMLIITSVLSFQTLSEDLSYLASSGPIWSQLTIMDIYGFISSRFSSYIVVVFVVRSIIAPLWKLVRQPNSRKGE